MKSPECDLKGHGPCRGSISQRGISLNHMRDLHIRLQSYWTGHNPGKKLNDWLDELGNAELEETLRKSPPRGKHWQEVSVPSSDDFLIYFQPISGTDSLQTHRKLQLICNSLNRYL